LGRRVVNFRFSVFRNLPKGSRPVQSVCSQTFGRTPTCPSERFLDLRKGKCHDTPFRREVALSNPFAFKPSEGNQPVPSERFLDLRKGDYRTLQPSEGYPSCRIGLRSNLRKVTNLSLPNGFLTFGRVIIAHPNLPKGILPAESVYVQTFGRDESSTIKKIGWQMLMPAG
jgi:hypothetical protein